MMPTSPSPLKSVRGVSPVRLQGWPIRPSMPAPPGGYAGTWLYHETESSERTHGLRHAVGGHDIGERLSI
jgi:hypothetical protein